MRDYRFLKLTNRDTFINLSGLDDFFIEVTFAYPENPAIDRH